MGIPRVPMMIMLSVLVACGGSHGGRNASMTDLHGSATVRYGSAADLRNVTIADLEQSRPCTGAQVGRGFEDFRTGADVVVKNQANVTIATGLLGDGAWADAGCRFEFSVPVPKAEFYKVEIGNRGGATLSRADLEAGKPLDLSLGI